MLTSLLFLFVLVLLNAFFAASEIALISLNDNRLRMQADEGDRKARVIVQLLKDPSRFLATIQIGITLAGFLASAFASESFADPLVAWFTTIGVPLSAAVLKTVTVFLITLILSWFTLVLGELVPKRIALQKAEEIARAVAMPLTWLSKATKPFVRFLTVSTNFFVRLCGVDPHAKEEEVTEEEIRMMVDVGEEKGAIHETEKEMINNIFDFDNKKAADVMTHRTEIAAFPLAATIREIAALVRDEKYTRFPVTGEGIDDIIGIVHVKDLIQFMDPARSAGFSVQAIMRKPFFVPESKRTDELFREMQRTKTHMAVVVDEYGGTAGIITIEDLVEEIVGNIFDEYDEEEEMVETIDENNWVIDGGESLDAVCELLETELPVEEYDTLSGYVIGLLGRIPSEDERPVVENTCFVFAIEEMEEKRISQIRVTRKPVCQIDDGSDDDED